MENLFWLGQLLHDGLGLTGPIWIMSASAADTEEEFRPVGRLDSHLDEGEAHPAQPTGPRSRRDLEPNRPGSPVAKLVDRQAGEPITGFWCRSGDSWQACSHARGHHRGDLILGVDTSAPGNDIHNRLAEGIGKSRCFAEDVLLVLVTTPAIDENSAAHSAVVRHIVGTLAEGKARCSTDVRQIVLLACPTTVAALLGSALTLQGRWRTADFGSGTQQYELTF